MPRFSEALKVAKRTVRRYVFPGAADAFALNAVVPANAAPARPASATRRENGGCCGLGWFIGAPEEEGEHVNFRSLCA
ncbi:hypothetical protein GCM10023080_075860 [Streptomyces pseudoechinosporeus]